MWWLTKCFADHVDIFHMNAEMGNDERTEIQLWFQDSWNPSIVVTTPKVSGTGLNLSAANNVIITQKFWVLNEQWQAFACLARAKQSTV
jgi:SNF2 family DNA or RNA helicase